MSDAKINLEAPQTNPEQNESQQEAHTEYEIFIKVGSAKVKENIEFPDEATIDQVINSCVAAKRELFKGENPNLYDLYIAKKDGEPKDDYPAMDRSQKIALAKVKRFVVLKKSPEQNGFFANEENEEVESYCFCFTKPKRANRG